MKRLAYIPARGGSKGIPKKNIAEIGDMPLIAFTIVAALKSGLFDKVMVSTDSDEIAEVARLYGAWVPFLRYAEFAQDTSRTIDAVISDKTRLEEMGEHFDELVLLQCTSPFRTAKDIQGAVALAEKVHAGVVSISPVEEHPILMRTVDANGRVSRVLNCSSTCRRQDMPPYYRVNGAIYINFWNELSPDLSLADNPYGYVMERKDSLDIDTKADLHAAQVKLAKYSGVIK